MSYTYYQAKNPTTININDEHVTESELPERLLELNNKTQNINANGTTLSNITSIKTHNFNDMHTFVEYMYPIVSEMSRVTPGIDIPYIHTGGIQMRSALQGLSIFTTDGSGGIIKFNENKTTECFGALTATNISSTNKTDIETLQTKTFLLTVSGSSMGVNNTSPTCPLDVIKDGSGDVITSTCYNTLSYYGSNIVCQRAKGSKAVPAGIIDGDVIMGFYGKGYHTGGGW